MAEAIVIPVLQKLVEVAIKEALFLHGVQGQVEAVQRELIRIKCFLEDADSKGKADNRVQNWIKEFREVSYWIEDVVEMFLIEVQQIPPKQHGLVNKLKSVGKKSAKWVLMHKLGDEVNKIQKRIKEISDGKETYGIQNLGESSSGLVNRPRRQLVVPSIDKSIVGFDVEKKEITELLLDGKGHVVSIVGQGGLGKTTLAQKIYNSEDVKNHFDVRIWLTISQDFTPVQLLRKILRELGETNQGETDQDEEYLVGEIHKSLSNKKYLVVLDDIWKDDVWSDTLQQVFPDVKNGSRVMITTRFLSIANTANPRGVHYLRYLNNAESLELLLVRGFPGKDASECYPPDLLELTNEFVHICGGLPLALVVLGGLISTRYPNYSACYNVIKSMNWQSEGIKCGGVIATSYEDLPLPLKACFIYLAIFAEDFEIKAQMLIQLWVAEGFISDDAGKTMEDTAENYLEELAQRCMIQVLERSTGGTIEKFRIHDLLRDLAIYEAGDKNMLKVFSKQDDFRGISEARRAVFHLKGSSWRQTSFKEIILLEYNKPNVRSLIFFQNVIPFGSKFKLLRVLVIQDYECSKGEVPHWWNSLKGLLNLRCIMFDNCNFPDLVLPIDNMHNLQTLSIIRCEGIKVPISLWLIKTLRHVIMSHDIFIGVLRSAPINLLNLQTLILMEGKREVKLFNMPDLRELFVYKGGRDDDEPSATLLKKLGCLVKLTLQYDRIPLEIIDTRAFPSYRHLQSLELLGEWQLEGVVLAVDMFPPHLIDLTLESCEVDQDLMPILEKLKSLKVLEMNNAYTGKIMGCSAGGFCQLQKLEILNLYELKEWKIEEGTMPMLNHLEICYCPKLRMLPDLQHVRTLEVLMLKFMPKEFNLRVKNEDQYKIKHIPSIVIFPHF